MKKYIEPRMECTLFNEEDVVTASGMTAEEKLWEKMTGSGYGLSEGNIFIENW